MKAEAVVCQLPLRWVCREQEQLIFALPPLATFFNIGSLATVMPHNAAVALAVYLQSTDLGQEWGCH